MADNRRSNFGLWQGFLELSSDFVDNTSAVSSCNLSLVLLLGQLGIFLRDGTFSSGDNGELLASLFPLLDLLDNHVNVVRNFWQQDNFSTSC